MGDFPNEISHYIWRTKYRFADGGEEHDIADTWRRVAHALAAAETKDAALWEARFFDLLSDFKFLPGGRIQAGAGTDRHVTLFNCFVMGAVEDSIPGIFRALQEGARTMQQGGGIGIDFSTLRPRGTRAKAAGTVASGPVSFMKVWDAMCGTILSTGARRGAMMATLRCDHPDIDEFVTAKQQAGQLRRFNVSVLITDDFMNAVRKDHEWPLVFPAPTIDDDGPCVPRTWAGAAAAVPCRVVRTIRARQLWDTILRATYDSAEPGVLFIDRINQLNNLWYRERISATNPCGEIPLPPYGACDLGSLNLTQFVHAPFSAEARLDEERIAAAVCTAVRLLDNVTDISGFPLPEQATQARGSRRIGLGITGLADALIMLRLRYGDAPSLAIARHTMRLIRDMAYRASIALAREKRPFSFFARDRYLQGAFIRELPDDIQDGIAKHGIRNSHMLAIAPTGTISLLAGNVSSGLEPVFAGEYRRNVLDERGRPHGFELTDYALALWRRRTGTASPVPNAFVTASDLPPECHLDMQGALQPFVDNSISKTINVPADCPYDQFKRIYDAAYDKGLKGCTTFRPNSVTGAVLSEEDAGASAPHCCVLEREAD